MNPTASRDMHSDVLKSHFLNSGLRELSIFEIATAGELLIWNHLHFRKMCELKPQLCGNPESTLRHG